MEIVLDHHRDIRVDLERPALILASAIPAHRWGLHHLASEVRKYEQAYVDSSEWPSTNSEPYPDFGHFEPFIYCSFNWFATSITAYLRLIALVDLVNRNGWSELDLVKNKASVKAACREYVEGIVPTIMQWRNKVSAHPAATDPYSDDSLGTLFQSISYSVSRTRGQFEVGRHNWRVNGEVADLRPWSITATYEWLGSRFWPEDSIKPLRHRPGSEPPIDHGYWTPAVG